LITNKQVFAWTQNVNGLRDSRRGAWQGTFLANFKRGNGDNAGVAGGLNDRAIYTADVKSFYPNGFGIYNMAGNVSEWTASAYYENAYGFEHDLNPDIRYDAQPNDPITMKRKVIRGGSWKDVAYFCQTGRPFPFL